jgi:hypothetical protein
MLESTVREASGGGRTDPRWYRGVMPGGDSQVTCPHCHKDFAGTMLGEGEQRGFKCPHCRLFVPVGRTEEPKPAESGAPPR